jgi:peptidoglycan/xylan/chitin deacetylase (PgdA/CDA1 family)
MSRRQLAAALLGSPPVQGFWNRLNRGADGRLCILAYHRVLDDSAAGFPFDEGLISATVESFHRQMEYARRNFDVLTFADLWNCEKQERPWPRRPLIVTFDDGYRDNLTHAFPVLRQLGIPATIFLATGHIGTGRLFWWDRVAYCIKHTPCERLAMPEFLPDSYFLRDGRERRRAIQEILEWLKRTPEERKEAFLNAVAGELRVRLPADIAAGMHLSWDEVRFMVERGIEFGSHTVTHPILTNVTGERLLSEVVDSKNTLERELGTETIAFSYPVGRECFVGSAARAAVSRCGFLYAVCYEESVARLGALERMALPRIHVESGCSLGLFRANLTFSSWMLGGGTP